MSRNIDFQKIAPEAVRAIHDLEQSVQRSGLEPSLLELVRLRASYQNGCAFCVDLHIKEARARDESEQRLYAVPLWRETPFFTPRERAALAWTEAVTALDPGGVLDDVYHEVRAHFTESQLVNLTMAVVGINCWNRLAVTFQAEVGSYKGALSASRRVADPRRHQNGSAVR